MTTPELSWALAKIERRMNNVGLDGPMLCADAVEMIREMEAAVLSVPCRDCRCPFRCHSASSPFSSGDPRRPTVPCKGPIDTKCKCKGWLDPVATLPGMSP